MAGGVVVVMVVVVVVVVDLYVNVRLVGVEILQCRLVMRGGNWARL